MILTDVLVSMFKTPPRAHQLVGVRALLANDRFALFDEMGAGKSKQVVDAACCLFAGGVVDRVVVVCPAAVRDVWADPEMGEIEKHGWGVFGFNVQKFTKPGYERPKGTWNHGLKWLVVSYDHLRQGYPDCALNLESITNWCSPGRAMLVVDESSCVASPRALQTQAVYKLRQACARVVLLNGTPQNQNELDLYCQMAMLGKDVLGFKSFWQFRARHARMGGFKMKKVVEIVNREEIAAKIKPWCLRRLKKDCLDIPDKVRMAPLAVPLSPKSWSLYVEMREEMVAWLDGQPSAALHGGVRMVRLQQVCCGHLGGVQPVDAAEGLVQEFETGRAGTHDTGDEKVRALVARLVQRREEGAGPVLVWCRFVRDLDRLAEALSARRFEVHVVRGGQGKLERQEVLRRFDVSGRSCPDDVLLGQVQAGGVGLNLAGMSGEVYYFSQTFSLRDRLQSEDRVHRPGQRNVCTYTDVVATGPKGERTVEHSLAKALAAKEDAARWTCARWREELS